MEKSRQGYRWNLIIWLMVHVTQLLPQLTSSQNLDTQMMWESNIEAASGLHLIRQSNTVVMTNGLVNVTLSVPDGEVTSVTYKGSENLLETQNTEDNRGYWDLSWNMLAEAHGGTDRKLPGTRYKIVVQNKDQIEISFTRTWKVGSTRAPLNVDKRYVMLRDSPGFYAYAVLEHLKGWPAFFIGEGRIVFKLQENKFHYMAMSNQRQRVMPMPVDRRTGQVLDYKEAVLLTSPTNPQLKGEVDDKYLFSCENKDNKVHGWVSNDLALGFWMITPSNEFRTGGPFKQDLTSHCGPTILNMFMSTHYVGMDIAMIFQKDEYWKKVLGPVYVYLNSDASAKTNPFILWNDAKKRMEKEVASWPYEFPLSEDYVKSKQRGAVNGQLRVHDRYTKKVMSASSAYVGLAPPGAPLSWQLENKGFQFWTQTDKNGKFLIKNVIPGKYSLFAWVPGTLGDYKHSSDITITPGSHLIVKNMVFEAPRNGPTLWEIGTPDRTAAEFFIPDPNPKLKIHPYAHPVEKFRQYGLWERYKDLYPQNGLVYTVGSSNYTKDWFFSHVTRKVGVDQYEATTWQITFDLKDVKKGANYTLQLALASANGAKLQVRINGLKSEPQFTTGLIGKDNALARHGIHGLYRYYSIGIAGTRFVSGKNTIFLTQSENGGPFKQVMYDYLRLEGPA